MVTSTSYELALVGRRKEINCLISIADRINRPYWKYLGHLLLVNIDLSVEKKHRISTIHLEPNREKNIAAFAKESLNREGKVRIPRELVPILKKIYASIDELIEDDIEKQSLTQEEVTSLIMAAGLIGQTRRGELHPIKVREQLTSLEAMEN